MTFNTNLPSPGTGLRLGFTKARLLLATFALATAVNAVDIPVEAPVAPAPAPAAGTEPAATAPADPNQRSPNGWVNRLIANNPELKDVDPNTPEGQEKIRAFQQTRMEKMAPQIRQRMADDQVASHAKLRDSFGMNPDDFAAIEPLLTQVETLRLQQRFVAPQNGPGNNSWRGGPGGGFSGMTPQLLLGDTPVEPTVKEAMSATTALKALLDDPQANAAEINVALGRVRKARDAFQAVLAKAEADLQSVLTHKQEALLVNQGILD